MNAEIIYFNALPLCKCGCGGRVRKPHHKYIVGHQATLRAASIREAERKSTVFPISKTVIDGDIFVSDNLAHVILKAYADRIDQICCITCSDKRCRKRDGSCWEYE